MSSIDHNEPLARDLTRWTVSAVAWTFRDYMSLLERLLARKRDRIQGVYVPETLEIVRVADQRSATAAAHQLLDRYAKEPAGRISLEIQIYPPKLDMQDENVYRIGKRAAKEARALGLEGDIEGQLKRMARR